jgi:tRNA acetyltransferase TAN1
MQYAERMYVSEKSISDAAKDASDDDVGAEIEKELQGLKKPQTESLFSSIKLDTPCRQSYHTCHRAYCNRLTFN